MPRRTRTRTRPVAFEEVIVDQAPKRWTRELRSEEMIALPAADGDRQDSRVVAWVMAGLFLLAIAHAQPQGVPMGVKAAALSAMPTEGLVPASAYWPASAPGLY